MSLINLSAISDSWVVSICPLLFGLWGDLEDLSVGARISGVMRRVHSTLTLQEGSGSVLWVLSPGSHRAFSVRWEEKRHCPSRLAWAVTWLQRRGHGWPGGPGSAPWAVCMAEALLDLQGSLDKSFSSLASAFPSVWWGCWRRDCCLALSPKSSMVQSCHCLSTDTLSFNQILGCVYSDIILSLLCTSLRAVSSD